ncbi:hypothetical protein G9C98_004794 [Cotesia typhae]|uniref:Amidohydrolase-related domain-containing protein n=1 Tax=Cotesia typhae TaxID=2053667 RepID=A0A8J5V6Y0_9HYME|nr:hypothetical protein G9C98_004794 [Cotesia typhae]
MDSKFYRNDGRHFENKFEDYSPGSSQDIIDATKNDIHDIFKELLKEKITTMLNRLNNYKKEWNNRDDSSIYTGNTGIAYLYYLYGTRFNDESYITRAIELIERQSDSRSKRDITFLIGEAGRLALGAVIFKSLNYEAQSHSMVAKLKALFNNATKSSYDELLYGRAGYLYALLFVNKHIPNAIEDDVIKQIIYCILTIGKAYAKSLSLKYPTGNFPSSVGSNSDKLVHWCHGAPSMTMLFTLAHEIFGREDYLEIAKDCGEVIWCRGILKKGSGICHGVSGNAYTFLCLYQKTKELKHLYRACKFAEWCFDYEKHQYRIPDRPYSLFEVLIMSPRIKAFVSQRTVLDDEITPAVVVVLDEKIHEILRGDVHQQIKHVENKYPGIIIKDFGSYVLMPGLVDSHVHIDDPGRTQWEEFKTATKAAAAGGVTTVVDMPLNSIPPTTTVDNLKVKMKAAEGNLFVDVGFWGGVVPGNTFHAEFEDTISTEGMDPNLYETFLHSRPSRMEVRAISAVASLCKKYNEISRYISANPAKLCGLNKIKGRIYPGMDADFVVWDPESQFTVQRADILYKNKISPYEGKVLNGRVISTILRGNSIYENGEIAEILKGKIVLN